MNKFPAGARVVFIGDSITHNNMFLAHIVTYYREHFPNDKVEFYNCGISGGTLTTTLNCFDEDILPYNPTHAVIMIGINDSARWALPFEGKEKYQTIKDAFENYKSNLSKLCNKLEKMGVSITLCTQTPYAEYMQSDEEVLRGGSALLLGYANFVREFAKLKGYPICDYHDYFTRLMQTEVIYNPDRVHPTDRGQYYMAKCFLEFQGYDLGKEKELPPDVQKWHEVVGKIRHVFATEHNILNDNFTLTDEERAAKIKDYFDNEQTGPYVAYFKQLAGKYPEYKSQLQENIKLVIKFMQNQ
ncbi:MAG: hypothetical protein IKJ93_02035 [Clostridia bacterium]|nr:hypothetical protein [Clostridia bacterium]